MRFYRFLLFVLLSGGINATSYSQTIQSPEEFLGYPLGRHFTYHHLVVDYFAHIADNSEKVRLYKYGTTNERRDLLVAYVSSPKNLANLEEIRKNNLRRAGLENGEIQDDDIAIVWLSYNVHGNEANSTETAMKVAYALATDKKYAQWLEHVVVIIDPCLNPDGRDRYVNWYNQVAAVRPNPDINSWEHHEGWRQGRSNHYLFDLNRDWVWQTQVESRQRVKLYNEWLPHVHVDFHEQFFNSRYYFAPAAEPQHQLITKWQKEFQDIVGKNNARYFDEQGWLYFTRESFDLLYPGYGDTYPTFNGAIGMTYEMPGHSMAGLAVKTRRGDTLTLADRIDMHFTASIATIEASYENRSKLTHEFSAFFHGHGAGKGYVVLKNDKTDEVNELVSLLDKNRIQYKMCAASKRVKAYAYARDVQEEVTVSENDILVPLDQPKAVLAKVLFERNTRLADSLTYDITAWSLPFVYGLNAWRYDGKLDAKEYEAKKAEIPKPEKEVYAFLLNWTSIIDAKFLNVILQNGVKVNYANRPFDLKGKKFNAGSLVITRYDNEKQWEKYKSILLKLAEEQNRNLVPVYSGAETSPFDLGSEKIHYLKNPKIALLAGEGISSLNFGEIWYFLEQETSARFDIIEKTTFSYIDLDDYDVLILASGGYGDLQNEDGFNKLDKWVKGGGTVILFGNAIRGFTGEKKFSLEKNKDKEEENEEKPVLYPYADDERENIKKFIRGGIIRLELDNTHPLAFGYGKEYYTLKTSNQSYKFLKDGWNVGYIPAGGKAIAGFVGTESKDKLPESLVFGVEHRGRGKVVYFVDDPLFRAFWQNGKLLLANAIFFDR